MGCVSTLLVSDRLRTDHAAKVKIFLCGNNTLLLEHISPYQNDEDL